MRLGAGRMRAARSPSPGAKAGRAGGAGRPAIPGSGADDRRGTHAAGVPLAWSVAVGAYALVLYLLLAPPVAGMKDASELGLILAVAGVPHPTGYPLFVLLGHAFCTAVHAAGLGWWHAANAWSAVGAAVGVALFHALVARLIPATAPFTRPIRFALALAPAWLLGLNPVWLKAATVVEVHSWQAAWVSASGLLALHIVRSPAARGAGPDARLRWFTAAWGLLGGAGLAHHATSLFFLVPLGLALIGALRGTRRWRGSLIAWWAAGALVPLASYGFVAYRAFHPAPFQWPPLEASMAGIIAHVTGATFRFYLGHFAPSEAGRAALQATIYPLLFPGLLAFPFLAAAHRRAAGLAVPVALFSGAVLQTLFALQYGVADVAPYFLPPMLVALLSLPLGAALLVSRVGRATLVSGVLAVAPLAAAVPWVREAGAETRRLVAYDEELRARWRSIPFERGIVLWADDKYCRLRAYQILDGEHPDRIVEHPGMLTWTRPREEFRRRVGFDPLAGLALREEAEIALIPANIRRQTELPVLDFAEWRPGAAPAGPPAGHPGPAPAGERGR